MSKNRGGREVQPSPSPAWGSMGTEYVGQVGKRKNIQQQNKEKTIEFHPSMGKYPRIVFLAGEKKERREGPEHLVSGKAHAGNGGIKSPGPGDGEIEGACLT